MALAIKDALTKLHQDEAFKTWQQENNDAYLAHIFIDMDKGNISFQIGYAHSNETITTFTITENSIQKSEPQQVLKHPDSKILKLDIEKVITTVPEALDAAEKCQKENYPKHLPIKKFIILQHLEHGQVYNITYVSQTMDTLNIKVNAETGTIVDHKTTHLVNITKGEKQ